MVNVKSLDAIKAAYVASGSRAGQNYKTAIQGVSNWQANASSDKAETLWLEKVDAAGVAKRRQKALASISNADWQNRALNKGAQQIGPAISASGDKQIKGFAPYASALASVTLPDKTVDPVANLTQRAGAIVSALVAKKKEIKG